LKNYSSNPWEGRKNETKKQRGQTENRNKMATLSSDTPKIIFKKKV
jgi:hypothetical protein